MGDKTKNNRPIEKNFGGGDTSKINIAADSFQGGNPTKLDKSDENFGGGDKDKVNPSDKKPKN